MNSKVFWCAVLLTIICTHVAIATDRWSFKLINDSSKSSNSNIISYGPNRHLNHVHEFVLSFLETLRSFMTNFKKTLTEEDATSSLTNPVQGRLSRRDNPPSPTGSHTTADNQVTTPTKKFKPKDDDSPGDFWDGGKKK
ncbi:hypothetical protein WDU94_010649 [Cyamophila willieti]